MILLHLEPLRGSFLNEGIDLHQNKDDRMIAELLTAFFSDS